MFNGASMESITPMRKGIFRPYKKLKKNPSFPGLTSSLAVQGQNHMIETDTSQNDLLLNQSSLLGLKTLKGA